MDYMDTAETPTHHQTKPYQDARVAIVYDRLNSAGGAEKVLVQLQALYPEAVFFTSVYAPEKTPWLKAGTEVRTSYLQRIPGAKNHHRLFGWLMPFLFESFDFTGFDIVISVTSEAAKGVLTQPHQLHVCYLLTPTRYLWSHQELYEQQVPGFLRSVMRRLVRYLQNWDRVAAYRPDRMIPISKQVWERAKQYYRRPLEEPLYPPADVVQTSVQPEKTRESDFPKSFFFTWGRHVAYKQFDTVIAAAVSAQEPLVIAGEGPQTAFLKKLAKQLDPHQQYIYFLGALSDSEITWCLESAHAAVFPQEEDYGIVIAESLLVGCPVIAHKKSGATEKMTSGDGVLIPEGSVSMVLAAMQKIRAKTWDRLDIRHRARQYAGVRFSEEWNRALRKQWQEHPRLWRKELKGIYE